VTSQAEPRRHHYVPRCWLAGFTETREHDGRLWVTDFSREKQWASTPENAGHMRDLYRLPAPAPDPVVVERFFADLEGAVAPILKKIDGERRPPDNDELDQLLTFMAYQFVRLPSFRPIVLDIANRIAREAFEKHLRSPEEWVAALKDAGMDPTAPGAEYEGAKRFLDSGEWNIKAETDWYIHRAFTDVDRILARLRERYWYASITNNGRLIASDNPVILEGEKDQMIGFRNAEFVLYPISRHVFLTGTPSSLRLPPDTFKYFAHFNTMALLRTTAQVYSHQPDFVWLDANRKAASDWRLFSKEAILNSVKSSG
jgi:hypothetical protein